MSIVTVHLRSSRFRLTSPVEWSTDRHWQDLNHARGICGAVSEHESVFDVLDSRAETLDYFEGMRELNGEDRNAAGLKSRAW
jgi:hypothetical protein